MIAASATQTNRVRTVPSMTFSISRNSVQRKPLGFALAVSAWRRTSDLGQGQFEQSCLRYTSRSAVVLPRDLPADSGSSSRSTTEAPASFLAYTRSALHRLLY